MFSLRLLRISELVCSIFVFDFLLCWLLSSQQCQDVWLGAEHSSSLLSKWILDYFTFFYQFKVSFKAGGDVFHYLLAKNPKHFAKASPTQIQNCELHQGNFGTNGSIIHWKYTLDGKEQSAKEVLQDVDEDKKQISFKVIEGDLVELYKIFIITFHIETKDGVDFVTWTLDYELLNADNPHPVSFLNFFIELTKEVETHIFG